ncbi:Lysine exporter protein (LYSE/YGGA) (Part 1) [Syntrophaceticus schinkii]|uniref:Lysine exporter protein (LYSE/YGGA) (Part 1) n=1 Tax=Syntrophaceticus schinkii TaxID=499207 RepID=A0A0B7MIE3_9FIRM|nr:Lysine exporter protein (LYSE/YGGA) (Part 1) [Syntrophaceticus schinkii]
MSHQQGGDPQMQLAFIFATSFLIALSGALMPGPMLAVTIKESLEQGWPAGVVYFYRTWSGRDCSADCVCSGYEQGAAGPVDNSCSRHSRGFSAFADGY